jgi:hypothetical protein
MDLGAFLGQSTPDDQEMRLWRLIQPDVPASRSHAVGSELLSGTKDFFWTGQLPPLESGQNAGAHKSPEAHLFDRDLALSRA